MRAHGNSTVPGGVIRLQVLGVAQRNGGLDVERDLAVDADRQVYVELLQKLREVDVLKAEVEADSLSRVACRSSPPVGRLAAR